ncbi:MAG: rRNA methyltransferase [Micavibrio sp.]|nr:rRNA methyltransferase [Micavibrio sp.]|tara:strand:+ start:1314 stop:2084 length:771 start_codon:yes stop_codon:yes gene_type:complete
MKSKTSSHPISNPNAPSVVLVHPQMAENIGAATRAILNCNITDLRLVNPRDGWPNDAAIPSSSGAMQFIPEIHTYSSVEEAVSDATYVYATTARARDIVKPVMTARAAASDMVKRQNSGEKISILFGGERAGLTNEQLSLADSFITIPLNPDFSSLNLAQAVLLVSYEWAQAKDICQDIILPTGKSDFATKGMINNFFTRLEEELDAAHFFRNPDIKPTLIKNIRAMFTRAQLTEQEIKTLQGILSALIGKKSKPN